MTFLVEFKKIKRTALLPALLLGGILSGAIPIINLLTRSDAFVHLPGDPLEIILNGNWMMMALLNSFLMVLGTCILYHIEFADNAIQRMDSLPIRPSHLFLNKFMLLVFIFFIVFGIEGAALYFCVWKEFSVSYGFLVEVIKQMSYSFLMSLPVLSFMIAISSFLKNMWVTVGIGVIGIFVPQILNCVKGIVEYFPFYFPFHSILVEGISVKIPLWVAVFETILFLAVGLVLSKLRRNAG